ncbi:MAG TPA: DinB family protein [Acidimicrobiales bacterium]|nr:DinB family protein [Acidimicrobiales bacterium]
MDADDPLVRYLSVGRDTLRAKLEGCSEHDLRRPLTPTGTNLLGLAKHVASVVVEYVTLPFGRPNPVLLPWSAADAEVNADLWAPAAESTAELLALWDAAWAEVAVAVAELGADTPGRVPWWGAAGEVTFGRVLVHCIAEVHRHAGHADIVRELVDGSIGWSERSPNLPADASDTAFWSAHRARVQQAADRFS